jgi:hypothetical protein
MPATNVPNVPRKRVLALVDEGRRLLSEYPEVYLDTDAATWKIHEACKVFFGNRRPSWLRWCFRAGYLGETTRDENGQINVTIGGREISTRTESATVGTRMLSLLDILDMLPPLVTGGSISLEEAEATTVLVCAIAEGYSARYRADGVDVTVEGIEDISNKEMPPKT